MNNTVYLNMTWKNIYFQVAVESHLVESHLSICLNGLTNDKLTYKLAAYKLAHNIYTELRSAYSGLVFCGVDINQPSNDVYVWTHKFNLTITGLNNVEFTLLGDTSVNLSNLVNQLYYTYEMVKLPKIAKITGDYEVKLPNYKTEKLKLSFVPHLKNISSEAYYLKLTVGLGNGELQELWLSPELSEKLFNYYNLAVNIAENDPDTCFLIKKIEQFLRLLWQIPLKITKWRYVLLNKAKSYSIVETMHRNISGEILYQATTVYLEEFIKELANRAELTVPSFDIKDLTLPVNAGETYLSADMINKLELGDVILYQDFAIYFQFGQMKLTLKDTDDNKLIVDGALIS